MSNIQPHRTHHNHTTLFTCNFTSQSNGFIARGCRRNQCGVHTKPTREMIHRRLCIFHFVIDGHISTTCQCFFNHKRINVHANHTTPRCL